MKRGGHNKGKRYKPRTLAFDILSIDGGWLTAAQLAMETGLSDANTERTLQRQVNAGWLEKRHVGLALSREPDGYTVVNYAPMKGTLEGRAEYRVVLDPWRVTA